MPVTSTREHIVEVADQLFYQQGYEHTSFAHIARAVNISRGNFYHHFKSKDDILNAVIELRLANTQLMLDQWQQQGETPRDRIRCFIQILIVNRAKIKRYGCPLGTLSTELAKLEHDALVDANKLFGLFRKWLKQQFEQLGFAAESDSYALHLLARSQGVATLAQAFRDEKFIKQEVQLLCSWLDESINAVA